MSGSSLSVTQTDDFSIESGDSIIAQLTASCEGAIGSDAQFYFGTDSSSDTGTVTPRQVNTSTELATLQQQQDGGYQLTGNTLEGLPAEADTLQIVLQKSGSGIHSFSCTPQEWGNSEEIAADVLSDTQGLTIKITALRLDTPLVCYQSSVQVVAYQASEEENLQFVSVARDANLVSLFDQTE